MKQVVNTTIEDVSLRENIGYDDVLGALNRQIETKVNWSEIDDLGTIGIDEIALQKGRKKYAAIVSARQKNGQSRAQRAPAGCSSRPKKNDGNSVFGANSC